MAPSRSERAAGPSTPLLFAATTRIFTVVPIRFALGVAALAAAVALSEGSVLRHFVIGALLFGFVALASETRRLSSGIEVDDVPEDARYASAAAAALDAALPSTAGVALLAAASLAFEPRLTALLAGVLVGMGIAAVPAAVQLTLWERRRGLRFYASLGFRPHLYARRERRPS